MKRADITALEARLQLLLDMEPGSCMGCGKPIEPKSPHVVFSGLNLLNPCHPPDAKFHTTGQCEVAAAAYEELWVKADTRRRRGPLTAKCVGFLAVHGDGSAECNGRNDGSDCPTVYAKHKGSRACWDEDEDGTCPRGCTKEGHPGTKLAKGLTPEGFMP